MFDWKKIVKAILVGVVVGLVCLLLGSILPTLKVPPLTAIGDFLQNFCWAIGVLAAFIWYFFGTL